MLEMTSLSRNSEVTTSVVEGKLNNVIIKLEEAEARLVLFIKRKKRGMCTKDIFQAAKCQLSSRRVFTSLDKKAIKRDMNTKIRDAQAHIVQLKEEKIRLRQQMLTALGGKKYLLRKLTKKLNTDARAYRLSLDKAYIDKIEHYEKEQAELRHNPAGDMKGHTGSLEKYISVIQRVDMLEPEQPGLPMICDRNIKLSHNELSLLTKGPKFSVRSELNDEDFEVELETMISKQKYRSDEGERDEDEELGEHEKGEREKLDIAWEENRTTAIFDWQDKTVSLARQKANKYKYNKNVCMPKVSDPQTEARHDIRKQATREVYRTVKKTLESGMTGRQKENEKKEEKREKKNNRVWNTNLSKSEQAGLKSLQKRISSGELVVVPTDKSSKFAVLRPDQYIGSGMKHVKGDKVISVDEVSKIQKTVNAHVNWLNTIFNTGADWKQQDRMGVNTHDEGAQTCGLHLLIKDHKMWSPEQIIKLFLRLHYHR